MDPLTPNGKRMIKWLLAYTAFAASCLLGYKYYIAPPATPDAAPAPEKTVSAKLSSPACADAALLVTEDGGRPSMDDAWFKDAARDACGTDIDNLGSEEWDAVYRTLASQPFRVPPDDKPFDKEKTSSFVCAKAVMDWNEVAPAGTKTDSSVRALRAFARAEAKTRRDCGDAFSLMGKQARYAIYDTIERCFRLDPRP